MTAATEGETAESRFQTMMNQASKTHSVSEVFEAARNAGKERNFLESYEVILKLNVDPKYFDQNVRGTCVLPAGTGKDVNVCVFSGTEYHDEVKEEGADIIGSDEVLANIAEDKIEFDKIIATPE